MPGHMQESLALSKLAEDIYDTVLDSALWTSALGKVTDFVEGQSSAADFPQRGRLSAA